MTKQEEIREGIMGEIVKGRVHYPDSAMYSERRYSFTTEFVFEVAGDILNYLHSQGVVIKVDRELPYKWGEFTRKHSYRPFKEFTTYTLKNKYDKMFGYIQKYQSLTGYECFEKPVRYCVYLGNEAWAHSDMSFPTLRKAREHLRDKFLKSKDNPDNEIPAGYVAVEPLIKEAEDETR